jgi:RNA polymerase sigma-70 factor (ECF subfamily)
LLLVAAIAWAAAIGLGHRFRPRGELPVEALPPTSEPSPPTLDWLPPVVVRTEPASGARDVAWGPAEIRVTFSKEMADESWSWCSAWQGSIPESMSPSAYDATGRTCALKVDLQPATTYAFWLNSDTYHNFQDRGGRPAVPYLLIFRTRAGDVSGSSTSGTSTNPEKGTHP